MWRIRDAHDHCTWESPGLDSDHDQPGATPMRSLNFSAVDLNLLRVFDAIYRERHLTRAGTVLCLSQPATSHALARLRTLFEDELFVRTTRGLEPTPRATELAAPISEAVEAVQRAIASANGFDPANARMRLRVGLTDFASWVILPTMVTRLRRDAPGIDLHTVHVTIEAARDLLDRGQLDLAIVASAEHPARFVARHALTEPFVCLLARNHPAIGATLDEQAFLAAEHILVAASEDQRSIVDRMLAERDLRRRIAVTVPFLMGVPKIVASSAMLCTVPLSLARELSNYPNLRWLPLPFDRVIVDYFALWSARDESIASHRWLRELTLQCCREREAEEQHARARPSGRGKSARSAGAASSQPLERTDGPSR
jgi:DNA-binding transcriptional LysR family regulator